MFPARATAPEPVSSLGDAADPLHPLAILDRAGREMAFALVRRWEQVGRGSYSGGLAESSRSLPAAVHAESSRSKWSRGGGGEAVFRTEISYAGPSLQPGGRAHREAPVCSSFDVPVVFFQRERSARTRDSERDERVERRVCGHGTRLAGAALQSARSGASTGEEQWPKRLTRLC